MRAVFITAFILLISNNGFAQLSEYPDWFLFPEQNSGFYTGFSFRGYRAVDDAEVKYVAPGSLPSDPPSSTSSVLLSMLVVTVIWAKVESVEISKSVLIRNTLNNILLAQPIDKLLDRIVR